MAAFTSVTKLATKWRHLHWFQIWWIAPHALLANFATRWHYLHCLVQNLITRLTVWVTCIATLPWIAPSVPNLTTRKHHLNWFQIWPPNGNTCIGSRFANFATRWHYLHCLVQNLITRLTGWVTCIATLPWIALLVVWVSIDLISPSARDTSVKFQQGLGLSLRQPDP